MVIKNTLNVDNLESLQTFSKKVNKGNWLVWFYADWCGHCRIMKDDWNEFSEKCSNNKNINLASVNDQYLSRIDEKKQMDVQGFPTIVLYSDGKKQKHFDLGERNSENLDMFVKLNVKKNNSLNRNSKSNVSKSLNRNSGINVSIGSKASNKSRGSKASNKSRGSKRSKASNKSKGPKASKGSKGSKGSKKN